MPELTEEKLFEARRLFEAARRDDCRKIIERVVARGQEWPHEIDDAVKKIDDLYGGGNFAPKHQF